MRLAAALLGGLFWPAIACADAPEIEAQIQRITDGLLPPFVVTGKPMPHWTLAGRMFAYRVPGVSIVYIHGGSIAWARGFGVTRIGGPSVSETTLFQAASISKPVTALAALMLARSGKINLDADVNDGLKDWRIPASPFTLESPVTLRALLSHTAGVTVHGFAGYAAGATIPSLIEILDGVPPANNQPIIVSSRPGHQFHYSGGGYTIVQKYLSDTTGESFEQLMRETVLTPLGMAHSAFAQPLPDGTRAEAATPYLSSGEPVTGGAHIYPELAAAGLWTTASDLARFAIALQNALGGGSDAVLPQNLARAMVTPVLDHYGLGLEVGGEAAQKYFAHDGVNFGFVSLMVAYETGDGAVIMTNGSREQLVREILRGLAAEYDWPDFRPTPRAAPAAH